MAAATTESVRLQTEDNKVLRQTIINNNNNNSATNTQAECKASNFQDIVWNQNVQTLRDFVASRRLPAIARVKSADTEDLWPLCSGTSGSERQHNELVVRIHKVGKRKMVLARYLQWEKWQKDYVVSGDQVEIPASVKGWFEVVPEDGRPVEYCDSVGALYGDKPRRFLVRTPTVGYRLSPEDGASCWMPCEIRPGEVLTTGTMSNSMDSNNNSGAGNKKTRSTSSSNSNKGFFKRLLKSSKGKNKAEQDFKYLQCFDAEGKEIMIPLSMSGVFSPVGDATMASYDAVYELQDLILAYGLPVNAKLVHSNQEDQAPRPPKGVLRLYGTREEEMVVLSKLEKDAFVADSDVETVEVSLGKNLVLQHGLPKSSQYGQVRMPVAEVKSKHDVVSTVVQSNDSKERGVEHSQIVLPERVSKELKKFKSTGILDKLSVRAVRKERAKLREMRSDDVFSKRIVRHDLSYEDFFNGLDKTEAGKKTKDNKEKTADDNTTRSSKSPQDGNSQQRLAQDGPSDSSGPRVSAEKEIRPMNVKNRDLPPLPVNATPSSIRRRGSCHGSKDSLYDHLPPAPQPPHHSFGDPAHLGDRGTYDDFDDEDGYMVPKDVAVGDSAFSPSKEVQVRQKGPTQTSGKSSRQKSSQSELFPHDLQSDVISTDDGRPINIDELFSSTYSKKSQRLYGTMASPHWTGSTSQLYDFNVRSTKDSDAVSAWRADVERHHSRYLADTSGRPLTRTSLERLDLETPAPVKGRRGHRSRAQQANATIRSHNLRSPKASIMELFHFSDSFRDLTDKNSSSPSVSANSVVSSAAAGGQYSYHPPVFPSMRVSRAGESGTGDSAYGGATSSSVVSTSQGSHDCLPRPQPYSHFADGDPLFHNLYGPSSSLNGFVDCVYPKQGDDSAISVGSRENTYGFNSDGDFTFQYNQTVASGNLFGLENNWFPPDDISGLSVQEVSKSLRYIGMKDRVVLRFANEQIDGDMLCSLDKKLLKEGFPELNALEIKKILDFVRGWRPKKR